MSEKRRAMSVFQIDHLIHTPTHTHTHTHRHIPPHTHTHTLRPRQDAAADAGKA